MNIIKSSNPVRLIAFFLTAILLISTFGFTSDGWKDDNNQSASKPSNDQITDENFENANDSNNASDDTADIFIPKYYNRLTGIETTEAIASGLHLAFILDSSLPCYGISNADIICEIPTEKGSRLIALVPESYDNWKIGPVSPTRGYISNISKFFSAISISFGIDDSINYNQCNVRDTYIDLSKNENHFYTEYTNNVYSNSSLLTPIIKDMIPEGNGSLFTEDPFIFRIPDDPDIEQDGITAEKITLTASDFETKQFVFNCETSSYLLTKNHSPLSDAINGKRLEFTNCFILFADSIIYDNAKYAQMVMDTIGNGVGYYLTGGKAYEINWASTAEGKLTLTDKNGEELYVTPGKSYIYYCKASVMGKITFE